MNSDQIRESFLAFFRQRGHEIVPSASLLPAGDSTLLFTNAGMNQFKDVFLGTGRRSYTRAADTQKCVRAGGKHNDLEEVGKDTTHHTFFEMLGNWSFGDYYKRETIRWAWELLTEVWHLPPERIYASVFREDDEAEKLWLELTSLPAERIQRFDEQDNFWEMGETGPCGPCSEIHFDLGPEACSKRYEAGHRCSVNGDCDRIVEIWNLVFIQFERLSDGSLRELPAKHVDTGMGFERIVSILQGKRSNYDTDLFRPLINEIESATGVRYGQDPHRDMSIRVVADHLRALTFLISDGVLPENEGRGYVLRRILRRALRHGNLLGLERPFLHSMTSIVVQKMGDVFPELEPALPLVQRIVRSEEDRFISTLRTGTARLEEIIRNAREQGSVQVPGSEIFQLYDTYGFPPDLARDALEEEGMTFTEDEYRAAMEAQRTRARASWKGSETELDTPYRRAGMADWETAFHGYERLQLDVRIRALLRDGQPVEVLRNGERGEIVLAETPFYAEGGGQVADQGVLESSEGVARVLAVERPHPDLLVHHVKMERGELHAGSEIRASIRADLRRSTARNHTATHLLHAALRSVLGEHVKQAGSLVAPDRLRFDFTHFASVTPDELHRIEDLANRWVMEDHPLQTRVTGLEDALSSGAMALFGEKYSERVRVVEIPQVSVELCGGTHVERTGQIGQIVVLGESSVSAGMRRIEAVTGTGALQLTRHRGQILAALSHRLNAPPEEIPDRVETLQKRLRETERQLNRAREIEARSSLDGILASPQEIDGIALYSGRVDGSDPELLRSLADRIRQQAGSSLVVLGSVTGGRVLWIAAATPDLTDRLHAGRLIGEVARMTGGGGGGRPDMAQAGGKNPDRIDEALAAVPRLLESTLER